MPYSPRVIVVPRTDRPPLPRLLPRGVRALPVDDALHRADGRRGAAEEARARDDVLVEGGVLARGHGVAEGVAGDGLGEGKGRGFGWGVRGRGRRGRAGRCCGGHRGCSVRVVGDWKPERWIRIASVVGGRCGAVQFIDP